MDKYIAVRSPDLRHLEQLVNAKMKEGYRPHGGLCLGREPHHPIVYVQAMML